MLSKIFSSDKVKPVPPGTREKQGPILSTAKSVDAVSIPGTPRARSTVLYEDLFPGISAVEVRGDDFARIKDQARPRELAWLRVRLEARIEREGQRQRVFLVCDKCHGRVEGQVLGIGQPCFHCGGIGGVMRQMTVEEAAKYQADRERMAKENKAKSDAARKAMAALRPNYRVTPPDYAPGPTVTADRKAKK